MLLRILNWTPKLFTLVGVPFHLHISFLLFLAYFGVFQPEWLLYIIGAFVGVGLHEYGHVLAAKYYGINTHKIILCPLGGVALLERMPRAPVKEFVITAAGPLVSLILAIWCGALAIITFKITMFFLVMAAVNGGMFLFNMLPVFPMDGGRMFRSMAANWVPYYTATKWAVRTGQVIAAMCALAGLIVGDFMLVAIMGLVAWMAQNELDGTPRPKEEVQVEEKE